MIVQFLAGETIFDDDGATPADVDCPALKEFDNPFDVGLLGRLLLPLPALFGFL